MAVDVDGLSEIGTVDGVVFHIPTVSESEKRNVLAELLKMCTFVAI